MGPRAVLMMMDPSFIDANSLVEMRLVVSLFKGQFIDMTFECDTSSWRESRKLILEDYSRNTVSIIQSVSFL